MSYRKQRNEWSEFIRRHGAGLRACGIPEHVFSDRMRFFVFLDHGYDQWGWAKDRNDFFTARDLSVEELSRLADFVTLHIDESYDALIRSRWQRWYE